MKDKKDILIKLFLSTLYLSAFTFGGGYVIITLLKSKFVDELKWIEEDEMLDLVAIAQSSPGPIAVNGAIVVGYKLAGLLGIIVSVIGAVLPPLVILSIVSLFYKSFCNNKYISSMLFGMQSGVSAVIISVVYDMGKTVVDEKNIISILIMIGSFIASYIFKINVVLIILLVACIGIVRTIIDEKKEAAK